MCKHKEPVSLGLTIWPKRPDNFDILQQKERGEIDYLITSELLHKYYLTITHSRNPRHWDALLSHKEVGIKPVQLVQSVWEDGDISFLRRMLMSIIDQWEELCPRAGPCPVSFDEKEIILHRHEEENREYITEVLNIFRTKWEVSPSGMIGIARFDQIKAELMQMRIAAVDAATNEKERILADKLWPYQDTLKEQVGLLEQSNVESEGC